MLTTEQTSALNIYGAEELRRLVNIGVLPDCVEVNSRIAERCLWNNPQMWAFGKWFLADYTNSKYRNGQVYCQRITRPDGTVMFRVACPGGRWCDNLEPADAQKHLRAKRSRHNNRVVYLNEAGQVAADRDYNWAVSR